MYLKTFLDLYIWSTYSSLIFLRVKWSTVTGQ